MRSAAALAAAALLLGAASAHAAKPLAGRSAQLHALAVGPDGLALAVVDSGLSAAPFRLVRSSARRRRDIGVFGGATAEFPDVASGGDRAVVAWARPISGGSELYFSPVLGDRLGRTRRAGTATGPARLGVYGGAALLAFPDEVGDVGIFPPPRGGADGAYDVPRRARLTDDAPEVRHHPLDVAVTPRGPLVLDLAQRRRRSTLIVLGDGAPRAPVVSVPGVRHIEGAMAASRRRVAVAYFARGRAVLAIGGPRGGWRRRTLPGPGGGVDAPVPVIDGGRVHVAYVQTVRGNRDLVMATIEGRRVRTRRLSRGPADDRGPHAAIGGGGRVYVGWTRRARGSRRYVPLLRRVG